MAGNVRQQIDSLATANSDNTQWALAQVDVELLALQAAILQAQADPGSNLRDVRQRFDILYSRINTVSNSPLFRALRESDAASQSLARIDIFLSDTVPIIDSSNEDLRSALPELAQRTASVRSWTRQLTLEGVGVLSRSSDAQRVGIADTLSRVSIVATALLVILILMLAALFYMARLAKQQAQEESLVRARLASVIATSLDAILVVGRDGRVKDFNGAAEGIFGYRRDEAMGELVEDLIVPDHLKAAHRTTLQTYLKTGEKGVIGKGRVQLEGRRKNGEVFPLEVSVSTAESEDGEIFVAFLRDISRREAAKQELIKARDDAVAGERAKAELIAVMSHEMRTPLNGMLGTLDLIDPEKRGPKDAAYLDIIRASGNQLLYHVDNVLEVSRAEAGKMVLAHEPFSIRSLVREVVDGQQRVAETRGNHLSYSVRTRGQDYAIGDPVRIRQVLLNLVGNAIKFTRNGTVEVEAVRLDDGNMTEFRVKDTGIGIQPQDLKRVFDEFVTLDVSYTRAEGGTGLGLSIVKHLAKAMGGTVGLESAPGEGSLFWVRLPLPQIADDADPFGTHAGPAAEAEPVAPRKILIVEDNRINRIVLRDLLEQDGHQVDEATNGQLGVEATGRSVYDLVFMDISMPVLDGVEATRAIRRAEGSGLRLPIIALTAHALPAEKERFRAAGMDDILVKPISRKSLRQVLQAYLGQKPAAKAATTPRPEGPKIVDHAQFDELSNSLGRERAAKLVEDFLGETGAAIDTITQRLAAGETDETIRKDVHHAAGSAALLGAELLRGELARVEEGLKTGERYDQVTAGQITDAWQSTVRVLEGYLRSA